MYVTIRRYADRGSVVDKLVPPVRDGLLPMLKGAQGFKGYHAFASEDGHIISVSVFDDRQSATRANDQVREWVVGNLKDLLPNPPEVMAGEARRDIPGQGQGGAEGLYVVIRQYDGVRSIERLVALADEHVIPVLRQAPGLRGHYVFTSGEDQSRVTAVSIFDNRENAMRLSDQIIGIMRERAKDIAPDPPRVTSGTAAITAMA